MEPYHRMLHKRSGSGSCDRGGTGTSLRVRQLGVHTRCRGTSPRGGAQNLQTRRREAQVELGRPESENPLRKGHQPFLERTKDEGVRNAGLLEPLRPEKGRVILAGRRVLTVVARVRPGEGLVAPRKGHREVDG